MSTKTKSPPAKNAGEVLGLLKLPKSQSTTGYAAKLAKLLSFLYATADIRDGAAIVESDISIDTDGTVVSFQRVRSDYIGRLMSSVRFHEEERNNLRNKMSSLYHEMSEYGKIIRSKAKVNTDEKKEKAQKKVDELSVLKEEVRTELNELDQIVESLKAAKQKEFEATDFPIKTMREKLELLTGCKIKIVLETGSYTFPVPIDNGFYREVCLALGFPVVALEKPKIVREFTFPAEVLAAIKTAVKFVSNDDLRPSMTAVALEIHKNKLTVVATDAHRLFKSRPFKVAGPAGTYDYLIPSGAVRRLPKAVKEDFTLSELTGLKVEMLGSTIDLIDAKFPNWKVVMPTDYEGLVRFDRTAMIDKVKEVAVYSNKSTSEVNFHFNGLIEMSAQDVDFSFESNARMTYKEKTMHDLTIAFNGKFMAEALAAFKTEDVTFQAATPTKAALISDGADIVLLMPLMIFN